MDTVKKRNRPDETGIAAGAQLGRFADQAEEQFRASGFVLVRCASCAYRAGTFPNGCTTTVADAMKSWLERNPPFYCHHGMKGHGSKNLCAGYLMMKATSSPEPVRVPWKFSDEYAEVIEENN